MPVIQVKLDERSYPIHVGAGIRDMLRPWLAQNAPHAQLVLIADQNVLDLHGHTVGAALPTTPLVLNFTPGEGSKSLATAGRLYDALAKARIERGAIVLSFGGGVAGDLAGFVAATWLRGVRLVQIPTTLLAAVDASVGGKTGVNLDAGKNLVGAFHQPQAVFIDVDFLRTLSQRDHRAGLAESVKHALLSGADALAWLEDRAADLTGRNSDRLAELIAADCAAKARVVSADEREAGLRAVLNLGHTVGHALERLLAYELRHGECVALGLRVEAEIARARGWLADDTAERITRLLERLELPLRAPQYVKPAEVAALCSRDKKVRRGVAEFVLLRRVGQPQRGVADVTEAELAAALECIQPA